MINTKIAKNNKKFNIRFIFGIIFPILLSLIPIGISVNGYNMFQQERIETLSQRWTEKAKLVLNDVRSCWSFEDYLNKASNKFIKITNENPTDNPISCLNRSFTKRIVDNSQIWLFKQNKQQKRLQSIQGKPLQNRFKSAMRKIANALIYLKENSYNSRTKAVKHEKFISGVFGNQSLPKYIATKQEGILTPITFKGSSKYLLWFTTGKSGYCFIGVISPELKIDLEYTLQRTANRIFRQYKNQIAVAFCPTKFVNVDKNVILPDVISKNSNAYIKYKNLLSSVNKEIDFLEKIPYEKQFSKNEHIFLESYITKNNPYNAIIFAPKPIALTPNLITFSKAILITLSIWIFVFTYLYIRNHMIGLPLTVSFRLFFFIVGISATTLIFQFGQNIINESYSLSLHNLKKKGLSNLLKIDNDATLLVENYYAQLAKCIASKTYDILCTTGKKNHSDVFTNIRQKMNKKNLALDYLFLISPEYGSEYFHSPFAKEAKTIELMNMLSATVFILQQTYDMGIPQNLQRPIRLTKKQKSIQDMLQRYGCNFLIDLTNGITEKGGFFQIGTMSKTFFMLFILQNNEKRMVYSIFGVNSFQLFSKYLLNKISNLNYKSKDQYATQLISNDKTLLLPQLRNKIWQTIEGQNLLSFMNKSKKSSFPIYMSDEKNLYITAPMINLTNSTCGAILSLAELNYEKKLRSLINFIFLIITSLVTYLISSFITTYLVSPLNNIKLSLTDISSGNLDTQLIKNRDDELGVLSDTIDDMQNGLKEKQKLGKFVSTVFSDALSNSSIDQLKAGITFSGAILFSDIRSFTTMSEQNPPNLIATMLNTHLSNMSQITHKYEGQVEQFIGDAIVSVFPDTINSKGYEKALKAAQNMMIKHNEVQNTRTHSGNFLYSIGIGIDYGELIAGSLITDERAEFTVIGAPRTNAENNEAASKVGSYTKIIISKKMFDNLANQKLFVNLPQHIDKYELKEFSELL